MFGGSSLAGFALTEEDRQHGRYTLNTVVDRAHRCVAADGIRADDSALQAHHMSLSVHGTVTLELGGYLFLACEAELCFESRLVSLMIGAGDDPAGASRPVAISAGRFDDGFGQAT